MAFPPPDGLVAAGTLECGNVWQEGEHQRKRTRNSRSADASGSLTSA